MLSRRHATTSALLVGVVLVGLLFGSPGGIVSYVALAGAASWACNVAARQHGRLAFFRFLALACAVFAIARGAGLASIDLSWLYGVGYFAVGVATFLVVRLRTRRIQIEAILEAAMLGAGSLLLIIQAWLLANPDIGVSFLAVLVATIVFIFSLAFLGRGTQGSTMRWLGLSVVAILLSEIPPALGGGDGFSRLAADHLTSLGFIPLTLAALTASVETVQENRSLAVNRRVGGMQIATIFVLLMMPGVVLTQLATDSSTSSRAVIILFASAGITATVVTRFWLLIRRRDWSNHCDHVLAQLGEQLVLVDDEAEAARAVTTTAVKMGLRGPVIARVVGKDDQSVTATASSALRLDLRAKLNESTEDQSKLVLNVLIAANRSQVSVAEHAAGPYRLLVGANANELTDLEPYVRTLATQLALVLEALQAREETHKARANNRMRALVQDSSDIIFLVDGPTARIEFASPNLEHYLGTNEDLMIGAHPLSILIDEDRGFVEDKLARPDNGGEVSEMDVRATHADGHQHWLSLSVRDCTDDPDVGGLVYNFADINERKLAELQLGSSELQYRTMVMNASDVFAVIDAERVITFISPNIERLLGFDSSELIGTDFQGLFSGSGKQSFESYLANFEQGIGSETADIELRTGIGSTMIAEIEVARPDELGGSLMVSMRDVTENRKLAENIREREENDDLTGLLNRNGIQDALTEMLSRMTNNEYMATVTLDINDFNRINENLGYLGGDELLVNVASRLRSHMREGDALSRQSGDEFTLLSVHGSKGAGDAFAERIAGIFDEVFVIGGRKIKVKASIGAIVTDDVQGVSKRVLEASKMALNFAKADRHKSFVVFENWMREEAAVHFDIALDLADAMRSGEIHLAFQPIMSLTSNRVRTVEALLRWQHPVHGNVSPGVFVPIAERSGEIVELGRWALDHACRQTAEWNENLPGGSNLGVSVNLSLLQLEEMSEAEVLQTIVRDSGLDPKHLMVELTESVMITDPSLLRRQLDGFRQLGCKIAVDDFGSGVAGMSHLHDAGRLDVLKIDRRYIEGVDRREDARTIVSGVIDLAHRMGAKAVAEGIETPPQAEALRRLNCDYGQGFYLGRPMVANRIEKWFSQGWQGEVPALIDRTETW